MTDDRLDESRVNAGLSQLNAGSSDPWQLRDGALCKTFLFADFDAAFAFMGRVARVCAEQDHHPDWRNVWNRVEIRLWTHDADGITGRDFRLAAAIEALA